MLMVILTANFVKTGAIQCSIMANINICETVELKVQTSVMEHMTAYHGIITTLSANAVDVVGNITADSAEFSNIVTETCNAVTVTTNSCTANTASIPIIYTETCNAVTVTTNSCTANTASIPIIYTETCNAVTVTTDSCTANTVNVNGNLTANASAIGALSANTLNVNGNVLIGGNMDISGNIHTHSNLSIDGIISTEHTLSPNDKSTNVPTTEWVNNFVNTAIPIGGIIMWNGSVPPANWALCDGSGTYINSSGSSVPIPNLSGRFIFGYQSGTYGIGDTGGNSLIQLSTNESGTVVATTNDSHDIIPPYYVLAYIIRIN